MVAGSLAGTVLLVPLEILPAPQIAQTASAQFPTLGQYNLIRSGRRFYPSTPHPCKSAGRNPTHGKIPA